MENNKKQYNGKSEEEKALRQGEIIAKLYEILVEIEWKGFWLLTQ